MNGSTLALIVAQDHDWIDHCAFCAVQFNAFLGMIGQAHGQAPTNGAPLMIGVN